MFNLSLELQCLHVAEWLKQMCCSMHSTSAWVRFESDRLTFSSENWNKPRI